MNRLALSFGISIFIFVVAVFISESIKVFARSLIKDAPYLYILHGINFMFLYLGVWISVVIICRSVDGMKKAKTN